MVRGGNRDGQAQGSSSIQPEQPHTEGMFLNQTTPLMVNAQMDVPH